MNSDFTTSFENLNDQVLVEIAFGDQALGYEPDAQAAAVAELRRRKIYTSDLRAVSDAVNENYEQALIRSEKPLKVWAGITIVLTAITFVIPSIFMSRYSSRGYWRRYEDAQIASRAGLTLWFGGFAALIFCRGLT